MTVSIDREAKRLWAVSLDHRARAALQPGAQLAVHSVFERAFNLIDAEGWLIGLLGPRGGNGPATVVLASLPMGGLRQLGLEPGQAAGVGDSGDLWIGDCLRVAHTAAWLWRRPEGWPAEPTLVSRNVAQARELAFADRGADGHGLGGLLPYLSPHPRLSQGERGFEPTLPSVRRLPLMLRVAWQGVAELVPAWRSAEPSRIRAAARRLIGLGPGQTPSGDDLLAGFMVARGRLRPDELQRGAVVLDEAVGRTTDLGLARLRYAALGELDERSELALAAILAGDGSQVESATRELLGFGHSSGLDTLVGLFLGLS